MAAQSNQLTPQQAQQLNIGQRSLLLSSAVKMKQLIQSVSFAPSDQPILHIQPRNVGLIMGFLVEVIAPVKSPAAASALTNFGAANVIQNITFTDLNNTQRINTSGRHLAILNSARQGFQFGGTYPGSLPINFGNNFPAMQAPNNIASGGNGVVRMTYFVPLAYGPQDTRGAVYAGVVSATMDLALTLQPQPFAAAGADPLNAVYQGDGTGGYNGNVTVNCYQVYLDQLPMSNGMPVLPFLDLNTVYDLKTTTLTGMTANSDFPVGYPNFRDFLSTMAIFDNGGSFNGGSDVNYWSLVSANFTNLWKMTPSIAAMDARQIFMADPPLGTYFFDTRQRPISTTQFGNMELNLNASVVNAGAKLEIGFETFGQINQLTGVGGAGSLPAG